jgi:hypothetical protein
MVSKQDFHRAMRMLAAEIPLSARPMETARWLMEGGDCLGLFNDGPVLTREDLRTLALALSLRHLERSAGGGRGEVRSEAAQAAGLRARGRVGRGAGDQIVASR